MTDDLVSIRMPFDARDAKTTANVRAFLSFTKLLGYHASLHRQPWQRVDTGEFRVEVPPYIAEKLVARFRPEPIGTGLRWVLEWNDDERAPQNWQLFLSGRDRCISRVGRYHKCESLGKCDHFVANYYDGLVWEIAKIGTLHDGAKALMKNIGRPILGPELVILLESRRYASATELEFQDEVEQWLKSNNVPFVREHRFNDTERVDFWVDNRIALELKTQGAPNPIARQLQRYALIDEVQEVVLFTSRAQHCNMPKFLNQKPLWVALSLAGF